MEARSRRLERAATWKLRRPSCFLLLKGQSCRGVLPNEDLSNFIRQ